VRIRLLRGIIGSALAVALALAGSAVPARASAADGVSDTVITLVFTAYRILGGAGLSDSDVEKLVRESVGAITAVEDAVIEHIDGIEAANVVSDAVAIGREMMDYERIRENEILLEIFAMELGRAAANAYAKYQRVSSRKAKDQIGLAASTIYPITLVVRRDAGAVNGLPAIEEEYLALNRLMVAELEPTCSQRIVQGTPEHITETRFECVAANGEQVIDFQVWDELHNTWLREPVDLAELKERAAVNSAWQVAKEFLDGRNP
jgi:hypothetical protein